MSGLEIKGLSAEAGGKTVVDNLDLDVPMGSTMVLMGQNGSGKSTLANALCGRPGYEITAGSARLGGLDLLALDASARARAGLFVAAQYPVEIPGLSNGQFMRAMANIRAQALGREPWAAGAFLREAKACCGRLGIPEDFLSRALGSGMSGGEKKRNELLQLRFFEPKVAILDEIDSGLDVDAWGKAVEFVRAEQLRSGFALLAVSHYAKMAEAFEGARVGLLSNGRVSKIGPASLARQVEEEGFERAGA